MNNFMKTEQNSNASNQPVLRADGLTKTYVMASAKLEVLRGLSLEVAPGEIVAVVGASGSGKTTFLHALGGLDTPTAGRVLLQGEDIYALSPARLTLLRAMKIGFVFQSYHLLPELDALENVLLPARNINWRLHKPARMREAANPSSAARATELLNAVGLSNRAGHLPGELSGGEQQRVALARALMNDPDVILADEPTGNLDAGTGRQVLEHLFGLARSARKTMVMVTHNLDVAAMADRVLELRAGRLEVARIQNAKVPFHEQTISQRGNPFPQ